MAKTHRTPKKDGERKQPTGDRGEESARPFAGGIFAPEYLDVMHDRSVGYRTEHEARYGGPCEVLEQDDSTFAVVVDDPTSPPAAVFCERQWALLAAATLGACNRESSLALAPEPTADGRTPVVDPCSGSPESTEAGWLPYRESDVLRAMHVAETILSSPGRLAHLLEAAGPVVLDGAARILSRRLDLRPSWPKDDGPAPAGRTVKRYRLEEVEDEGEGPAEILRTQNERASWLRRTVAEAPDGAGGALYLDESFAPIGYTCHSALLEALDLPPRKIFAPALLSGASYVTVWHKQTFDWPAPSSKHRQWSYYVACCGRHLRITVLESVVLTHDGFVFAE